MIKLNRKKKQELEKWLKAHQFQYRFYKDYLFIKKIGIGWKISLYEFEYTTLSFDKIIDSYTCKPGYSQRWWEGDTLYSKTVD